MDPDIIVLGKGLGAGFPIGAIIISDHLEGFSPDTEELHTFANNTVSQVAGLKLIELLEGGVLRNCNKMGNYLHKGLREIQKDFPEIGDIRQAGLHIGIELIKDPLTKEANSELVRATRRKGMENGILLGVGGVKKNVLKIKPPLIITQEEADIALDLFRKSLQEGRKSIRK